ncbi:MAG: glycosyltransferase family 61 protein [Nostoc sp. ChiQUE01a]|nr:glycosyltransferase family 61 protein [Nostoc sp. ChiQUE01a]
MTPTLRIFQYFLIFKLIYPVLLKFIYKNLLIVTESMEQLKRQNDFPNLEEEYQQLPFLKFIHLILFNYLRHNFIDRAELIEKSKEENQLYQLLYDESVNLAPVICHEEILSVLKPKEGFFKFTDPFAAIVKDVELFGIHAFGFTEDKKIILETSINRLDCLEYSAITTFKQGFNFQYITPIADSNYIDLACSLVNCWSHLYGHWIYEGLTRLEALEYYSQKTGRKPKLIIDKNSPAWKYRTLELMGYRPEECIQWNGYRAKVNELVICSNRREDGRTSVKACHWLKERILSNIDNSTSSDAIYSPYIFLSRKKTNARRILNEEEVINTLAKMDFVPYVIEDLDFSEQVKVFTQAKFIISPHGSGLTNILFSQNLSVIELFGPKKISHFFYAVSEGLGFNYACMLCEVKNGDIIVNCEELSKMVYKMQK